MQLVAIAQIIRQVVFCAIVFALVRGPEQVLWVAWAEVAGVVATAIFCVAVYQRSFRKDAPKVSTPIHLFREGLPIGLSQMFWVVKMFGGTLILGLIASAHNVAFFAGAQRILIAFHTFVWLYYFNLLPSLARSWQEGTEEFRTLIARSMQAMVWIGVAGGLAWAAVSQEAIRFVYGPEFGPAGTVLALFAAVWSMALISGHYRFGLIAAGQANAEMATAAIGAVLALILIPVGYYQAGITGAAAGLVIAEAGIWISSWWFAQKLLLLKGNSRHLRLPLIALLLVLATSWLLPMSAQHARLAVLMLLPAILALVLDHTARIRLRQLFGLLRTS
jgi:O-antigen/teichoic acid export membrane protein